MQAASGVQIGKSPHRPKQRHYMQCAQASALAKAVSANRAKSIFESLPGPISNYLSRVVGCSSIESRVGAMGC